MFILIDADLTAVVCNHAACGQDMAFIGHFLSTPSGNFCSVRCMIRNAAQFIEWTPVATSAAHVVATFDLTKPIG